MSQFKVEAPAVTGKMQTREKMQSLDTRKQHGYLKKRMKAVDKHALVSDKKLSSGIS